MNDSHSSNISSNDLDEETKQKLKGDVIGDTLYSQSFVIKSLQSFSDLRYNEQIEEDLAFLWDMTVEADVCKYLFELKYPSLATTTLVTCKENRLIEILIGILANIMLGDCDNKAITPQEVNIVIREFDTDNTAILVQLMRFIQSIAYTMPDYINSLGDRLLKQQIQYILNNSQDDTLITETLKAVVQLTEDLKLNRCYVTYSLFESIVEGFDTVFSVQTNTFEDDIDSEERNNAMKSFLRAVTNVCIYASKYADSEIDSAIVHSSKLLVFALKYIKLFSKEEHLFPISPRFTEFISTFYIIVQTLHIDTMQNEYTHFFKSLFTPLCKILQWLCCCRSEVVESFDLILEFIGYLILITDNDVVLKELEAMERITSVIVLNSLKQDANNFNFDISNQLLLFYSQLK